MRALLGDWLEEIKIYSDGCKKRGIIVSPLEQTQSDPVVQSMTKNIIIGIGGTGLSAIRELRRLMAERYELGLQDPAVRSTRFVYVDTDGEDAARRSWKVLGKDISLRPGELAIVTGDQLKPIVQRPADYPDYQEWMPPIGDYVGDPGEGAKGIRPYGRLIYEYSQNKARIHETVLEAFNNLNQEFPHVAAWRYYIICSASGGTGSGMFLPLARDLANWHLFTPGMTAQKLRGFLILPPLTIAKRHNRYHANAFATLKELNYHGAKGNLPFSNVYLLEPINAAGNNIGLDNLPLLVAQRLFLNIQGGPAAGRIDALMDNQNLGNVNNKEDARRQHALCFSSFGLSSLSYPRETIARCVALRWATDLIGSWLEEREAPKNVNELVRNELPRLKLSKLHINGDGDPFGEEDFPPYDKVLPQMVDNKIDPLEKKQLGPNANKIREEIEEGFRGKGIGPFYQQREKDVKRAAEFAMQRIQLGVSRLVRERERGIRFAKDYLDELAKILESEYKVDASARFSPEAQNQITVFQRNYSDTGNTVSLHEEQWFYRDSEFARDKANLSEDLKGYLNRVAGYSAGKYATKLLDIVIPATKSLRSSMDVWHARVTEMFQKMDGRVRVELEGRAQDAKENGKVIFDDEILRRVAAQGAPEVVNPAIEARLRDRLADLVQRETDDLNLFALMEQTEPDDLVARVAFDFILSQESPLQVGKTTLYDRFLTDYPKPEDRQAVFNQTQGLSEVFTRWLPGEVERQPVQDVRASVVSIPDDANNQKAQTTVKADLVAAGLPAGDILGTQDVERIVFIRERLAFPVRFIESLGRLKEYYDKFPVRDALHIDRREVSELFEVFLLSDEEKRAVDETEETFLLARANGWLRLETNQLTLKPEVRYEYEIPGKIGKRAASFGADWDAAFDRFKQDALAPASQNGALREGRVLLVERSRAARQSWKTDPRGWEEQTALIKNFLDGTLAGYRSRTDDPRYARDVRIIGRIEAGQTA
jgi:hypothetical protein